MDENNNPIQEPGVKTEERTTTETTQNTGTRKISAMALVVCAVLYCIAIGVMCGDTAIGSYQVLNPTVWALVLMSIFGALSFLFGLFSLSGGKKRK